MQLLHDADTWAIRGKVHPRNLEEKNIYEKSETLDYSFQLLVLALACSGFR
jgi:hypothetical protein